VVTHCLAADRQRAEGLTELNGGTGTNLGVGRLSDRARLCGWEQVTEQDQDTIRAGLAARSTNNRSLPFDNRLAFARFAEMHRRDLKSVDWYDGGPGSDAHQ
jgi:hypothetical protein